MCQHLCVWDNQVIGYWRDEKETWETTKALEKEVGDGHGLQCVSLEVPKQAQGRGREKGGGGSLVNTALLLILPLSHPLWAGPDQCKFRTQHPSLQDGQLTCLACILWVSQSSESVWVHAIASSAIQAKVLRAAWHGSEKEGMGQTPQARCFRSTLCSCMVFYPAQILFIFFFILVLRPPVKRL